MELVEIRDLDGPNFFMLQPAIKVEVIVGDGELIGPGVVQRVSDAFGCTISNHPVEALGELVALLHASTGLPVPVRGARRLDSPDHVAVYYGWEWRTFALAVARNAFDALTQTNTVDATASLHQALERDRAEGDTPEWVRDAERTKPTVAITGTNGKTTTTRLVAHICREAGLRTGWSSSSGVYIDGEQVMEGDYTGPSGARRVLNDPSVDVAVLETARGGILLRGVAFESNDVSVMVNVTADHLSLHGIETVDTLAEVKSIVVRLTRPSGLVVLNADDPRVLAQRDRVRAPVLLTTQAPDTAIVREHIAAGGRALLRTGDRIVSVDAGAATELIELADAPATWGGIARHMVENVMCAAGAAIGLGLSLEQIRAGLTSFRSDIRSNAGRLNVFRLHGRVIVVDYAHNESGLEALIAFTRELMGQSGRLSAIVGTAGDRQDDVLVGIGRIAAGGADHVYIKENLRYLRGRSAEQIVGLIQEGVVAAHGQAKLVGVYSSEIEALVSALDRVDPDDAIAVMCVQDQLAIFRELRDRGANEWR